MPGSVSYSDLSAIQPKERRTQEQCETAVMNDWNAIALVPRHAISLRMIEIMQQQRAPGTMIRHVRAMAGIARRPPRPRTGSTPSVAPSVKSISAYYRELSAIPICRRTREQCAHAVTHNWKAIALVPLDLMCPEMIRNLEQQGAPPDKIEHYSELLRRS